MGVPLLILVVCHLLYSAFSGNMRHLAQLGEQERGQFVHAVGISIQVATITAYVLLASIIIRLFREEALGQALAVVGAVLYFGSPPLFAALVASEQIGGSELFTQIVNEFRTLGLIAFVPGLFLIVRDVILRTMMRFTGTGAAKSDEKKRPAQTPKFCGSCWDIQRCTEALRRYCPAWKARKSCWRIKSGCLCEGHTWQRPETAPGQAPEGNAAAQVMPRKVILSNADKKLRCRECSIYAEHQQQKYRIASVLVFPLTAVVLYLVYSPLSKLIYGVLERADKSLSFLSYRPGGADSFSSDGQVVTIMAIVWLAIVGLSYGQKLVEYLIFERQV